MRTYESRGVLAGAYRGFLRVERLEERTLRTHYYDVTEGVWKAEKTLCGRIVKDRLSDLADPDPATCPECVKRFTRRVGKGEARQGEAEDRSK